MKNIYYKILCLFAILIGNNNFLLAQVFAVTESGDHVILNSNGTWKQIDTSEITIHSLPFSSKHHSMIPQNENIFSKSSNATHLIKSKKIPVGFYLNNKYWGVRRGEKNESSEYYFFNKIDDAYAYMDIEATDGLSLEKFRENNLRGARKIMPDAIIKNCEYRIINGLKVLCTDIIGTFDNYKAEFLMYTYINEKGAVYVTVSNSQDKFLKYREIYEEFLNGIVSLEK